MTIQSAGAPLLVVGYANVDLIARLPRPAQKGQRVTVESIEMAPGGMAANTACIAASLGSPVTLFAETGIDSFSAILLERWVSCGVTVDQVLRRDTQATKKCLILVDPDGERTIISEQLAFDYSRLKEFLSTRKLPDSGILHFDGYRLSDFAQAAELARKRGLTIAADLDGCDDPRTAFEAFPRIDIAFSNQSSLSWLVGESPPSQALAEIAAQGPRIVILTGGSAGAWVFHDGSLAHVPGHHVDVVDTTGAGDVFDGAFLHAFALSGDAVGSARYANAAAAISTSGIGALGHMPTDAEITRLLG